MSDSEQAIDVEGLVVTTLSDVKRLLAIKGAIDESEAKKVRRHWDTISAGAASETADYKSLEEAIETLRHRIHKQVDQRDRDFDRLVENLDKLEAALKDGNLKIALSLEQSVTERLKTIDGLSEQRRQTASERLSVLAPEITKLKQWRHWGTTQARESLITDMEALVGAQKSPAEIAKSVQEARTTWKSWDKTGDSSPKSLWTKFDAACTKAYEPCKKHFDNLAEQRKKNLETRGEICTELETLEANTDWKSPVWRDIDRQVRELTLKWQKTGPVDRRKKKTIDSRYGEIQKKIDGRLERERTRSVKQRMTLTEEVRALKSSESVSDAIELVKDIQKRWRPSVLSHRKEEQKLWREFKAACDDVFAIRESERQVRDDAFEKNREVKLALIAKIESAAKGASNDVLAAQNRVGQIRQQWTEAGEVPRKHKTALEKRYKSALKLLTGNAERALLARETTTDIHIASLDALLAEYENATTVGELPVASIDNRWPTTSGIPEPYHGCFVARMTAVGELHSGAQLDTDHADTSERLIALKADWPANTERYLNLCLRLEVDADIESPPEYSKMRMQWQVDRLKAAMSGKRDPRDDANSRDDASKRSNTTAGPTREMLREWWSIGPCDPVERDKLQQRFTRILTAVAPDFAINLDFNSYLDAESPEPVKNPAPKDEPTNDGARIEEVTTAEATAEEPAVEDTPATDVVNDTASNGAHAGEAEQEKSSTDEASTSESGS